MAFGISRRELIKWKQKVANGEIAFITHYWYDSRFPHAKTVTKVGCVDTDRLFAWGKKYDLKREWIDERNRYPHYDLLGDKQLMILRAEKQWDQIERFRLLLQEEDRRW